MLVLAIWFCYLPKESWDPRSYHFLFLIGAVGVWRYGWLMINVARGIFYRRVYYPRLKKLALLKKDTRFPEEVFVLITTYLIPTDISARVYRAAFEEAEASGLKVTVVASVVTRDEEFLVKEIFLSVNPSSRVRLIVVRFAGTGKRDGLAVAMRSMLKVRPDLRRCMVLLVDGDSVLTKGVIKRCGEMFALSEKIGALTTNEEALFEARNLTEHLYKHWFHLRFALRHHYMSSHSLSHRVLTLTGRMSAFRGEFFMDSDFVDTVQHDHFEHWRLGWIRFLTGDDKSTWFYLISRGYDMLYLPDVMVYTYESPPASSFFVGATQLMLRWSGNSLRATYRAMKVPRKVMGTFMWWVIRDQRISFWTSLYGLTASVLGSFVWGAKVFWVYLWWVAFVRLLVSLFLGATRGLFYASWPLLLYFVIQIYGSFIKIYIINHLYRQKWTRQATVLRFTGETWVAVYRWLGSHLSLGVQFLLYIILLGFLVGLWRAEDVRIWGGWLLGG